MIRPGRKLDPHRSARNGPDPARDLQRRADRICFLIVASDYPDVDIDIEIHRLRRWCARMFPAHRELFEIIYETRFRRLRDQFRS